MPIRNNFYNFDVRCSMFDVLASIFLVCLCSHLVRAGDDVLYQAAWGKEGKELAGWTTTAKESRTVVDPKRGPVFEFGPESAQLRLSAKGGHQLRFKFTATYRPRMDAGVQPYAGERALDYIPLSGQWTFGYAKPDPQQVELGLVLPQSADSFVLSLSSGGKIAISAFTVVDLGPLPPYTPDGKELLTDPGWEEMPPRSRVPAENTGDTHLNGWMVWMTDSTESLIVTPVPSRVHTGKQALMVIAAGGGLRQAKDTPPLHMGRCYDLSVWAKGQGQFNIYAVAYEASPTFVVSSTEWRQFHFPVCLDNPANPGFSMGILVQGRIFLDDFSIREIAREDVDALVQAGRKMAASQPAKVVQVVPEGEKRSSEPVILENDQALVKFSPVGGGRIVEYVDKQNGGTTWKDVSLLALSFPDQPVPVEWGIPFRTIVSNESRSVTFIHTATGGAAAPFLDGICIEQIFSLEGRVISARFRLTNTSGGIRPLSPAVLNTWSPAAAVRFLAAAGDKGLVTARGSASSVRELTAGWSAVCAASNSLVMGFDVQAVKTASLDPARRTVTWHYLRVPLPPGGSWETEVFLVAVPLDSVEYADRNIAVQAHVAPLKDEQKEVAFSLDLKAVGIAGGPRVNARVIDYENRLVAKTSPGQASVRFVPPVGRFVTCLDIAAGDKTYTVELFNDPPDRVSGAGIEGAGEIQYAPTVPIRVLRFPDAGDMRGAIAGSKRILWGYGLFSHYYPLGEILAKNGFAVEILDGASGFPEELEELLAYRLVILSNLGAAHLAASSRASLSQYVRAGGALLVIGGSCALGNARTKGTDLEDMLPVKLTGPFEVLPRHGQEAWLTVPLSSGMALLTYQAWQDRPRMYWAHHVTALPGTKVLAQAGKDPALVAWQYGRGKVSVYVGTVEGEPAPGDLPAWEWRGWAPLWDKVLDLLLAPL